MTPMLTRAVAVAVLAGVLASAAAAQVDAPEGFRSSVRLAPIASDVARKPMAVYCARDDGSWETLMESVDAPIDSTGYAPYDEDAVYLAPEECRRLEGWLRGKNVPTLTGFGFSTLTLTHEATHARGVDDEGATDCAALAVMPRVLRVHFKVRKPATLKAVMAAAWRKHKLSGPAYQGNC